MPSSLFYLFFILALTAMTSLALAEEKVALNHPSEQPKSTTIAFGSCLRQWKPQPVWEGVKAITPRAFVFLGDNMYADVGSYLKQPDPQRIQLAYDDLKNSKEFGRFSLFAKSNGIPLYATWDDHDYGLNDAGADYPFKVQSKRYFQSFFSSVKTVSPAHQPGIYHSHYLKIDGLQVQLILLDTRSFRSPLSKSEDAECQSTKTVPNWDAKATILGHTQWQWLEAELQKTADIRIIASSIQVIPEEHCYEKWANFPLERKKLFSLIQQTQANAVIFISGDRHLAEISRLEKTRVGYPLYEVTASGLNSAMGAFSQGIKEKNRHRVFKQNIRQDNFGSIAINAKEQSLELHIHADDGKLLQKLEVSLDTLRAALPKK